MKTLFGESVSENVLKVWKVSQSMPPQRSPQWYFERYKYLTASELASSVRLIKHELDLRDNGIVELAPEKKVGQTVPSYMSYAKLLQKKCEPPTTESQEGNTQMQWGVAYEDIVVMLYQAFHGVTIHDFNLIPHATIPFLAASPDGITSDGTMIEIKCPYSRQPSGKPKLQYWMQMQQQMECCNMEQCDFLDVVIREYGNRESYMGDRFGDPDIPKNPDDPDDHGFVYSRTADGNPKGIMIDRHCIDPISGKSSHKYYYAPVLHFEDEAQENAWLEDWAKGILSEVTLHQNPPKRFYDLIMRHHETYSVRYWYIEQWNASTVIRDREWFAKRLPDFENFWNLVQKCRSEGIPDEVPSPVSDDTEDAPISRSTSVVSTVARTRSQPEPQPTTSKDCLFIDSEDE